MSLKSCTLFIIFLISISLSAQNQDLHTNSRSALSNFNKARFYYQKHDLLNAEKQLKQAIRHDSEFIEAHIALADLYSNVNREANAMEHYLRAIEIDPAAYPAVLYDVAGMKFNAGEYQESKDLYLKYKNTGELLPNDSAMVQKSLDKCDFALHAIANPVPFELKNLGEGINSRHKEYFPSITVDDQTFLFTRAVPYNNDPNRDQEDFYISHKTDSVWGEAYDIGMPINTSNNEGAPTLSADGNILIFTACERHRDYGNGREGFGSCDLFFSLKDGDSWTEPRNLGAPVNTYNWESQPSFSSDGKTLYFIRNIRTRDKSKIDQDIYVTELQNDGHWTVPKKLGPNINTPGREESVFIHPDGQTLYFSSDGHTGMGGLDIFRVQKDENGEWGEPLNLGYPINTHNHENSILISSDGKYAFFASNREGGYGGLDLYSFELPEKLRPKPITYLKGVVFDIETKQKLGAAFELINLDDGETVTTSFSNDKTGEFLVALPTDRDYALNVQKDGYLFYSDNFSLKGYHSKVEPFLKDIPLQPIKIGQKIILKNIFFELDKYDLREESLVELNKMLLFLAQNPKLSVEISGHTDDQGSDDYNQELSENRAHAVYEFLIKNGIDKERLSYKGYGESAPIEDNTNAEGRASNRRTEMKITGI